MSEASKGDRRENAAATKRGISAALKIAFGKPPLMVDAAADDDFASMIDRLRGEPGTKGGIKPC